MRAWFGIFVVLCAGVVSGCGGDSDAVAPARSIAASEPGEPAGAVEPQIGACKKLCCTSADCGTGKTCTPFASASGTLGVCTNGSDALTGSDPPAGATLPASCWSENQADCNALTSEGCAAGDACDYAAGEAEVEAVVSCFPGDNVQAEGESCDNALGPWCQPGLHCVTE